MPLKAREYEDRIKAMGFERATAWATMELIERHNAMEKDLKECGNQLLKVVTALGHVVDGSVMLREQVESLISRMNPNEDHPTPSDDRRN